MSGHFASRTEILESILGPRTSAAEVVKIALGNIGYQFSERDP
jgi:hypothetical protein